MSRLINIYMGYASEPLIDIGSETQRVHVVRSRKTLNSMIGMRIDYPLKPHRTLYDVGELELMRWRLQLL